MYNFEALSDKERSQMCNDIGIKSPDELFDVIPQSARIKDFNFKEPLSELEAQKKLKSIAKKNKTDFACFMGAGAYKKFIPAALFDTASRYEFLSAYTPYQAEISQGSLQIMYEFQTMICSLCAQDVANASVYDGASAAAEAILMACRITKNNKAFVSENINPNYLEVIKTYLFAADVELIVGTDSDDMDLSCKVYQTPDYFGEIVDAPKKNSKELTIAIVDISSLALIEPPKCDITVGDFQTLGLALNFGGPYGGFIACKDAYKRQLAGRIAGKTVDKDGRDAYVLTLQAREQHIRREKATSNICSNQAHCALCAVLYLSLLGQKGFREVNYLSYKNAHLLAQGLEKKGHKILTKNFFNEFVYELNSSQNAIEYLQYLKQNGILGGVALDDKRILTAVTELNDTDEINLYLSL